jgi:hypothetical protein
MSSWQTPVVWQIESIDTEAVFRPFDREDLRGATHNAAKFFAPARGDHRRKPRPMQRRIDSA